MFDRNETERNDALQGLFSEIGEGMAPPAALVRAVKGGVYLNPAAKRGTHVWKFAKAVVGYALGVMLFLGAILLLPKLWEGGEPTVGTPSDTTAPADDAKPFAPPAELRAEIEAAWLKEYGSPLKWWYEYSSNSGYGVRCYGTYNGCTVLFKKTDLTAVTTKRIAGYAFTCGNSFILCVYRDGEFKDLAEAYDDGWISAEDVGRAAERHEEFTGINLNELEIQSIIAAYAKQFGKDEEKLSVQIVGRYGVVRAVYVYEEGVEYGGAITEEVAHGLTFTYSNTLTMLIYRPGDKFYSLPDAAEQGVIPKENVRELYITHNFAALDFKEKVYCNATVEDEFSDSQIVIAVHPEFCDYPYTPSDFTEIGCVAVEEVAGDGALSSNGEAVQNRLLLLTLNKASKENVLKQIKLLEVERDVYTAIPYGYQKEPGVTPPRPEPPVTEPETEEEATDCLQLFSEALATAGKTVTISRELTADELAMLKAFIAGEEELRIVLSCAYEPFYRPEDISLYELMYASDIKKEFPDNPYQNDGSMMTATRIEEVVKQYLGIDVTQAMWDKLIADGAEYFADYDAYGFAHTDTSGFYPDDELFGYLTEDGKLLVHLTELGPRAHVPVLLVPCGDSFLVEAAERISSVNALD